MGKLWTRRANAPAPLRPAHTPVPAEPLLGYVAHDWVSPVAGAYYSFEDWPRLSPYFERTDYGIFVEVRPYEEVVARYPDEEDIYEQGFVWGMSFSPACVEGEGGHHHLDSLVPITPERFAAARAAGWDL